MSMRQDRTTGNMAVAAVNKANDDKQPLDCMVSPPVDQSGKAIRAADLAAMLCWRTRSSVHTKFVAPVPETRSNGIDGKVVANETFTSPIDANMNTFVRKLRQRLLQKRSQ